MDSCVSRLSELTNVAFGDCFAPLPSLLGCRMGSVKLRKWCEAFSEIGPIQRIVKSPGGGYTRNYVLLGFAIWNFLDSSDLYKPT